MEYINSITGYVIYDSSFTKSDNHMMTIFITEAKSTYGQCVSAKGLVSVIGKEKAIITSGVKITLEGSFSDGFFKYSGIQVNARTAINEIRERIIIAVEKRIVGNINNDSSILSTMLLLGRADYGFPKIKSAAQGCGCSHVLALSGMHLNLLNYAFKPIKSKVLRHSLSVLASVFFVFIAGPRPSLVRAFLMLVFCFLPKTEQLVICYLIQLFVLPFSMLEIGCVYSYTAIFAIQYLAPVLQQRLFLLKPFISSVTVVLMLAPIDLFLYKTWHPQAVLLSPVAGILVALSMLSGAMILIFGQLPVLMLLNDYVYAAILKTFDFFPASSALGIKSYSIFAVITILFLISGPIIRLIVSRRFEKNCNTNIMNP